MLSQQTHPLIQAWVGFQGLALLLIKIPVGWRSMCGVEIDVWGGECLSVCLSEFELET